MKCRQWLNLDMPRVVWWQRSQEKLDDMAFDATGDHSNDLYFQTQIIDSNEMRKIEALPISQ